jgi:CRISPR type III-B/RAMP module-associated protein Cmr5
MRDLERERAEHALRCVKELTGERDDLLKRSYRSYVDRFGGAVVMNGLGQALATEFAASDGGSQASGPRAHWQLYDNVRAWLCRDGGVFAGADDALDAILSCDQDTYVRAQTETLAWLTWHKKFCHALLPRPKGTEE